MKKDEIHLYDIDIFCVIKLNLNGFFVSVKQK
jgi:hypothetical protein